MVYEENKSENDNEIDVDNLLKGYADVIFNIWRMGKNAKKDYEINEKRMDAVILKLNEFIELLDEVNQIPTISFVEGFSFDSFKKSIEDEKKSTEKSLKPLKDLSKKYDRILKILSKNGFQIMDYDGKKFNDGMIIKVLDTYPDSEVEYDTIIETVKPSIFYKNKMILMGEVIVAVHEENEK